MYLSGNGSAFMSLVIAPQVRGLGLMIEYVKGRYNLQVAFLALSGRSEAEVV